MPITRRTKNKEGQWIFDGYRFDEDDVANQMAYLFAGEEGQKRAKKIREEAENIPNQEQRKQHIEQAIKEKATEVDQGFQKGLIELIQKLPTSGKDISGAEAGKGVAVSLMQTLGLNVNPDNVQTHYSPGPPQCFQISWVNRPTPELKDEESEINKLSRCYADSLTPQENQDFITKWGSHIANAKNDGPKIEKTKFDLKSAQSFEDFKVNVNQQSNTQTLGSDGVSPTAPRKGPH